MGIVLGGFSQGGLSYPRRLAGIVSISGWLPYRKDLSSSVHVANSAVPLLFTCGTADPVVDYSLTKRSGEMLKEVLGKAASVRDFERAMHQPDPGEMRAVHQFIAASLSLQGV